MLISHEVPNFLLIESLYFNDYDYFLIHLYKKFEEYKHFYEMSKKYNRIQILDNSACELRGKEEFDFDEFAYWVDLLKPTEYLIPDVFNDFEKNIKYFDLWMEKYKDLPGKKIATIHGSTEDEMIQSYQYFDRYDVKIAINFDECVYTQHKFSQNISMNKMLNRLHFIHKLLYNNIINQNKEHHILGCHLPQEFQSYKNMDWIKTIDTSNPIMAAFDGIKYNGLCGLENKPKSNIDLIQNVQFTDVLFDNLIYNVNMFKKICGR